jgi:hypothetical protein
MRNKRVIEDAGRVELALHSTLSPMDPGDDLVAASVGPDGEAIVLWSTRGSPYR